MPLSNADSYKRIYATVKRIPRGRVATYGQIATLAGLDGHARQVGYALHSLPDRSDFPWHRVINAKGEVSPRSASDSHELQRMLLEEEGVVFSLDGKVSLATFRWKCAPSQLILRVAKRTVRISGDIAQSVRRHPRS